MSTSLMSLPSELLDIILSNLPISSLLAFSATSKRHQMLTHKALHTLDLAVFPREINCRLAFMSQHPQLPLPDYDVSNPSNPHSLSCIAKRTGSPLTLRPKTTNPAKTLTKQIAIQNNIAVNILNQRSLRHLRTLILNTYDITSPELTTTIGTDMPNLQHLELNLSHPYIHDQCLSSNYWREPSAGNPCWNALVGLGQINQRKLRMRNLQSLRIERAGITSAQLQSLITSNPRLGRICLNNITGVDQEFVQWLGAYCESGEARLDEIVLENCSQLRMQKLEDFAWLVGATAGSLKRLSLWKCRNVNHKLLIGLIEDEDDDEALELDNLEILVPPKGPTYHFSVADKVLSGVPSHLVYGKISTTGQTMMTDEIEVDPEYLTEEFARAA